MTINVVAWTLSDGALVKTGNIPTDSLNAMLAKVKKISDSALSHAFYVCKGLTGSVSFPALTSIGSSGLYNTFNGCTNLTEVHFPAALSGNSQCTASYLGCTNATVYFDL